ncbi:alpha/beta hydrolase [Roseovarius sp. Pro17]|uniref:alpha/beta fold hydrolase n=1 Tax=Roseovarius sp. Pro17 TaxID=3108175 RepID=UPI002D76BA88|nr:alpha/beta hydrolase [Roseovarius sp. Pro17]
MTLTILRLSDPGLNVAYRDSGRGEPLILIHGVGMQSAAWGPQIAALSGSYRVIALDMPGHGGSDPLPQGSQLPDFVAWCRTVVQALDLGPVNLAGHSMGALIAAGFAASFPELTRRVALLNGVYCRDAASRRAVQTRAGQIQNGQIDLETPLARWFGDTPAEVAAKAQVAEWLGAVDAAGYATAYTAFANGDATYADQLPLISCPFLAMTGDGDPNSTPAMSAAMASLAQQGKAVTITGHRHMINLTAAPEVNAHLLTWLKQPATQKELQ